MVPFTVAMSQKIELIMVWQLIPVPSHGVLRTVPNKDTRIKIEIAENSFMLVEYSIHILFVFIRILK